MNVKPYIGDIGTIILIDMRENISSATDIALNVKKPDGTLVEWIPTIYNTRYLRYAVSSGDLNQAGTYTIQPGLTLGTWTGLCDTVYFTVYPVYT